MTCTIPFSLQPFLADVPQPEFGLGLTHLPPCPPILGGSEIQSPPELGDLGGQNQPNFVQLKSYWLGIDFTGTVTQQGHTLTVQYALRGNLDALDIPAQSQTPTRADGLWEGTCFEFFLGQQGSDPYWEFNLAPTGDWNVYRFDRYRQGMTREATFSALPFKIQTQSNGLDLTISLSLTDILPAATLDPAQTAGAETPTKLEMAISAVLKAKSQALTYWALIHPGPEADFHRRDSFVL